MPMRQSCSPAANSCWFYSILPLNIVESASQYSACRHALRSNPASSSYGKTVELADRRAMLPTIANTRYHEGMEEPVPTRNINLTPQMDRFVEEKIQNGQYANASEVIRAGLRALEGDEREEAAKIDALREAINAGEASGLAKGDVIGRLRMRLRRRAEATGAFEK